MRVLLIAILLICVFSAYTQESKQKVVMTLENPCDCPARYSLREFVRTVDGYMIPSDHKLVFGVIDKESKKRITVLLEKTYPVVLVEVWNFYDDSDDWKEHKVFTENDCIKYDTWYAQDGDDIKIECK